MDLAIDNILLIGSFLLFISVIAGKTSYKFGVPTLLFFLCIGMLSGSEGIGGIPFDNPKIAQFIGIVSLNFILFSGGLDTNWSSVKPVLKIGLALSSVGVVLTATSLGLFVWILTDFTIYESMLLGSIVSSTDAAAVFSILRSRSLGLKANLRSALELESGSNDPMAYVLTLSFLTLVVHQDKSLSAILPIFFQQMALGALGGYVFGRLSKFVINGIKLDFEGLYPVLVISLMFIAFASIDAIGGNGFLAIYICAVYLGNQELIYKRTVLKMYDGLAWLMQIVLFLTLGLLVFPSQMIPIIGVGLLVSVFLIFVARPFAVFISLALFKMPMRKKLYISWVGLRGAVPIVFATYPLLAGIDKANVIFNIVFFVSVTSVLVQGTTLSAVAKWLKVSLPEKVKPITEVEKFILELPKSTLKEIEIGLGYTSIGKRIFELKLPPTAFIALIKRKDSYIRPGGSTAIEAGDTLVVLADTADQLLEVEQALQDAFRSKANAPSPPQ